MLKDILKLKSAGIRTCLITLLAILSFSSNAEEVAEEQNTIAGISTNGTTIQFQSLTGEPLMVILSGETGYNITLGNKTDPVSAPIGKDPLPDGKYRFDVRSQGKYFSDQFLVTNGLVHY